MTLWSPQVTSALTCLSWACFAILIFSDSNPKLQSRSKSFRFKSVKAAIDKYTVFSLRSFTCLLHEQNEGKRHQAGSITDCEQKEFMAD